MTRGWVCALMLALSTACAGAQSRATDSSPASQPPAAPKILTIGIQREPASFTESSGSSGGARNAKNIVHDDLVVEYENESYRPQLATELPSVEKGTWRVNPDGSMDVTWRIRPNVRWHDGTAFTSADLLFGFRVATDPGTPDRGITQQMQQSAEAPDPTTFTVHWSQTYIDAGVTSTLVIPRHLLEELWTRDRDAFFNSTRFTTDFVGLGPYKLDEWSPGSHMRFLRFDDYYRGRPPLDTVWLRFIGDPNTMAANFLAETVDALLPFGGVEIETAMELKRRWEAEGSGHQVRADPTGVLRLLEIQYRPDIARPRNGLATNVPLRQGLYQAIDRQSLTDAATSGLAPIADSYYTPNQEIRRDLDIPQYRYDAARAQQLVGQAGWSRGPDGVLVHAQTGDRLELEIWGRSEGKIEREQNIIGDGWKVTGAQVSYHIVPPALQADREYQSSYPGVLITEPSGSTFYTSRLHSNTIPSADNRWTGTNRGGYRDPRADALYDKLIVTIDPRERLPLHRELLRIQMGEVVTMPLYWTTVPVITRSGVKGHGFVRNNATWDFFEWDKD